MLIRLVHDHTQNQLINASLLNEIKAAIPNILVDEIKYGEIRKLSLDTDDSVLLLLQDKLLARNLQKQGFDVVIWKSLPDLLTKIDMFLQLRRYKIQHPLDLKNWTLKEVLHNSDDVIVYRAENNQGLQAAIKQFKFLPSTITEKNIQQVLSSLKENHCVSHSKHLVTIYEGGICDQSFYLVMEYLKFGTLRQSLNGCGNRLPLIHALEWFREIVMALDCVHKSGLIHRDLKIDNILLRNDGTLALFDYGVSKRILLEGGFVSEQQLHCSPYYVSPEQLSGDACTQATDIYSLGVILFELLSGRKPYEANQVHELMMHHVMAPLPVLPNDVKQFQPLIDRMMAKNPEDRFSSVLEIVEDLPIAA